MKMQPDKNLGINMITAYDHDSFSVNGLRFNQSLIIPVTGAPMVWQATDFDHLIAEDFAPLLTLDIELVILGTGSTHRFPPYALRAALMAKGVGIEFMATAAALRTYNILAGEGRLVAARQEGVEQPTVGKAHRLAEQGGAAHVVDKPVQPIH